MSRSAPPPLADGVIVQSVTTDRRGTRAGYRIFGDGRYESLDDGGDWVQSAPTDAALAARVQRAVDDSALDAVAERIEAPPADGGPSTLWFQAVRAGVPRSILVLGSARVPELEQLTAALVAIFGGRSPKGGG